MAWWCIIWKLECIRIGRSDTAAAFVCKAKFLHRARIRITASNIMFLTRIFHIHEAVWNEDITDIELYYIVSALVGKIEMCYLSLHKDVRRVVYRDNCVLDNGGSGRSGGGVDRGVINI